MASNYKNGIDRYEREINGAKPIPCNLRCVPNYLDIVPFLVRYKINSSQAVHHKVLSDPLIRVLTSLCTNPDYFAWSSEVNLYPLVSIIVLR